MNRLRKMSVFAHIVESGSISGAAEVLNLSKSVISQHLKSLEFELGLTLLKRTTRRQVLTKDGERFYQSCKMLNEVADSAWSDMQESHEVPRGRVRITAPNALMEVLITPVIGELLQKYPLIEPELISNDLHLDFLENDIDLAIRVGQSKSSNLKQRRLGQFRDVLCKKRDDKGCREVDSLKYISNVWQGKQIEHEFKSDVSSPFIYKRTAACTTSSFHSTVSFIKAGVGIGLIPDFYLPFVEPEVERVFPDHHLTSNAIYAINPFDKQMPLTVDICLSAIEQQLSNLIEDSTKRL